MTKILIVQAPYYQEIAKMLLEGAISELKANNIEFDIVDVCGALEIPTAIAIIDESKKYDGFIALGCVIRGQTSHYDYVCQESCHGLNMLGIKKQIIIGNGIITVENKDQAQKRADIKQKNKGGFAAKACIDLIKIKDRFADTV
jgi:6,7-dimethyl-8-ribityllumazine synthase